MEDKNDLVFSVMPGDGKNINESAAVLRPNPNSGGNKKWIYIIIGIIVVLLLAGGAYYMLGMGGVDTEENQQVQTTSKLPNSWIADYFGVSSCEDNLICGDDADPDSDGLSNVDEWKAGTNPQSADTDADGLADGDEVNVYKTEPLQKYTDKREVVSQNNWSDGYQVKNGYDPTTSGKFTDTRLQQIESDKQTYHLHEPTLTTTTSTNSEAEPQTMIVTITSAGFTPSSITINKGDTIRWTNNDTVQHHVASDPHPTHSGLPGLESQNLTSGQAYEYTFTTSGTFGYHDHLNPTIKGTVVVQ